VRDARLRVGRAERSLGPLRAGEELHWSGRVDGGAPIVVAGVRTVELAVVGPEAASWIAAVARPAPLAPMRARHGPSAADTLAMLRARLVAPARGCLRRDRSGRGAYAVRAVFQLAFVDREVEEADVAGAISPELRRCLLEATDALDVPSLSGRLLVRYPIATRAEPAPVVVPLPPELDAAVERVGTP